MAKFVELEHIKKVLNDYPSSNSNKILYAIEEEYIYDYNDIRSIYSWIAWIIISLFVVYCMFKFGAVCNI